MIPEAAVEAAAIAHHGSMTGGGPDEWGYLDKQAQDNRLYWMRAALEAAAPQMLAGTLVDTGEELDALPVGTVVLSEEVKHYEGGWPISYQRWQDGAWHRGGRSGSTHPDNFLPVTILHRPAQ